MKTLAYHQILIAILFSMVCFSASGQSAEYIPKQNSSTSDELINYYGTTDDDSFYDIVYDEANNIFFGIGYSNIGTPSDRRAIITKLNNCGEVIWTKHYFAADNATWARGLLMADGNLLVLGYHDISSVRHQQKLIAKINSTDGSIMWMNSLKYSNRALGNQLFAAINDPAGETYYISSWILNGADDNAVVKIDNAGNILFQKQYAWSGDDQMGSFPVLGGGFATCGSASGYSWRPTLSIFDNNGNFVTGRQYPDLPASTEFNTGIQTPDGGFMLGGRSRLVSNNYNSNRPMIARVDENYNLQWVRLEMTDYFGQYRDVVRDANNHYHLLGDTNIGGQSYVKISKFDENYNYLWTKYLDAPSSGIALKTTGILTDKIVVAGYGTNQSLGIGGRDAFLAVLDTELNSCITISIDPPVNDTLQSDASNIQCSETILSTVPGTYDDIGDLTYAIGEICTTTCIYGGVLPGDCNVDGIVNIEDMLYWGLAVNFTGAPRPNATTDCNLQACPDWSQFVGNPAAGNPLVNGKHQDGDGNGIVDGQDSQVILNNYGCTNNYTAPAYTSGTPIYRVQPQGINGNDKFQYDIYVENGSGAPAIAHGLAFTITSDVIPISAITMSTANSSLQPDEEFAILDGNQFHAALTRINNYDITCNGPIATLFVEANGVPTDIPFEINVTSGAKIKADATLDNITGATAFGMYSGASASTSNLLLDASVTHEQCNGLGGATAIPSGGIPPYTYAWSTGASSSQVSNLASGTYTVTVTDDNGVNQSLSLQINGQTPIYDANGNLLCGNLCPEYLAPSGITGNGLYNASNTLNTDATIPAGNTAEYKAGQTIQLKSGFKVQPNAEFSAEIEDCQ